jgi:hypothetical protein
LVFRFKKTLLFFKKYLFLFKSFKTIFNPLMPLLAKKTTFVPQKLSQTH